MVTGVNASVDIFIDTTHPYQISLAESNWQLLILSQSDRLFSDPEGIQSHSY